MATAPRPSPQIPSDATAWERFLALVRWLASDEAMALPLREVEARLAAEGGAMIEQMRRDYGGASPDRTPTAASAHGVASPAKADPPR